MVHAIQKQYRLAFRALSGLFLFFIVAIQLIQRQFAETSGEQDRSVSAGVRQLLGSDDDDDNGTCAKTTNGGLVLLFTLGTVYMFLALAIICDEYFVPALEIIGERLNMKDDVSGATLMAAGGSAPELFTSIIGTFNESDVGIGTIVGSAVFNVLFVIGMCAFFSLDVLELTWWPLFRDCLWYMIALALVGAFFANGDGQTVTWWEALILLLLYQCYVLFMYYNEAIEHWVKTTVLKRERGLSMRDEAGLTTKDGKTEMTEEEEEDPTVPRRLHHGGSDNNLFNQPSTFRMGVLDILLKDRSAEEVMALHVVSRVAGTAEEVFNDVDKDGDGFVNATDMKKLLQEIGLDHSDEAAQRAVNEIIAESQSPRNEGVQIELDEFREWYVTSEERLKKEVDNVFNECDDDGDGRLGFDDLREIMARLDNSQPTSAQVSKAYDEILGVGATKNKVDGEQRITMQQFKEWYFASLFWQAKVRRMSEANIQIMKEETGTDEEGPQDIDEQIKAVFLFPLTWCLSHTLVDVSQPHKHKYCYYVFFGSIFWIGIFSNFMVTWATIVGTALGIPDIIMGLTFLAAGTSVPDLLSSVVVARQGFGDMAVSSSIGSNIFDVLMGLPIPWLLFSLIYKKSVHVNSDGIAISIFILLSMLISVVVIIMYNKWKLTRGLGVTMFSLYFVYVIEELIRAAVSGTINDATCQLRFPAKGGLIVFSRE